MSNLNHKFRTVLTELAEHPGSDSVGLTNFINSTIIDRRNTSEAGEEWDHNILWSARTTARVLIALEARELVRRDSVYQRSYRHGRPSRLRDTIAVVFYLTEAGRNQVSKWKEQVSA